MNIKDVITPFKNTNFRVLLGAAVHNIKSIPLSFKGPYQTKRDNIAFWTRVYIAQVKKSYTLFLIEGRYKRTASNPSHLRPIQDMEELNTPQYGWGDS